VRSERASGKPAYRGLEHTPAGSFSAKTIHAVAKGGEMFGELGGAEVDDPPWPATKSLRTCVPRIDAVTTDMQVDCNRIGSHGMTGCHIDG
jgi:hypothetical protein